MKEMLRKQLSKIPWNLQYILECVNGFIYGLKMPFSRCCICGTWSFETIFHLKNGKVWCGCKNKYFKVVD